MQCAIIFKSQSDFAALMAFFESERNFQPKKRHYLSPATRRTWSSGGSLGGEAETKKCTRRKTSNGEEK